MKAQFVKTFIKAAAIVALATSIANCGAMPEESITETTYQPSSQPADPAVDTEGDDEAEIIIDNCESWGMTYDVLNNTCVDDELDTNVIDPVEPEIVVTTCEDFGLVEENGTCVNPIITPEVTEPEPVVDGCEAFGLVEEAGTCVDPNQPVPGVIVTTNEGGDIEGEMDFTMTPGERRMDAAWSAIEGATSYTINHRNVGASYWKKTNTTRTSWGFLTTFCTPREFQLVAHMADGTTEKSMIIGPVLPTNCE